jgi:hypothetical protein
MVVAALKRGHQFCANRSDRRSERKKLLHQCDTGRARPARRPQTALYRRRCGRRDWREETGRRRGAWTIRPPIRKRESPSCTILSCRPRRAHLVELRGPRYADSIADWRRRAWRRRTECFPVRTKGFLNFLKASAARRRFRHKRLVKAQPEDEDDNPIGEPCTPSEASAKPQVSDRCRRLEWRGSLRAAGD